MKNSLLSEFCKKYIDPDALLDTCGGHENGIIIKKNGNNALYIGRNLNEDELKRAETLFYIASDNSDAMRPSALANLLKENISDAMRAAYAAALGLSGDDRMVLLYIQSKKEMAAEISRLISEAFAYSKDILYGLVDPGSLVVVKVLNDDDYEILETATAIQSTIAEDLNTVSRVGISLKTTCFELYKAFDEAKASVEMGALYQPAQYIHRYSALAFYQLMSRMPADTLKQLKDNIIDRRLFDREMLSTVKVFFNNNLNISSASRELYIHRNSLIYRLDKIMRFTGFDIRRFDDAVTLRLLLSEELK